MPNTHGTDEVPVLKDRLNVKNEVPITEKEVPIPWEQISVVVTDIPSPCQGDSEKFTPAILAESPHL